MTDRLSQLRGLQNQTEVKKIKLSRKEKKSLKKEKKKNKNIKSEIHEFNNLSKDEVIAKSEELDIPIVSTGTVRTKDKRENLPRGEIKRLNKKPETAFFIEMFFSNGTSREFVVSTSAEVFRYKKRWYYLRFESSWFNLTQNQYKLNYFDDSPVPIDREITKKGDTSYFSVSPDNLKPLIDMEYVKALASSQQLDKYLKMIAIICVIILFFSMIALFKSFQAVKYVKLLAGV